MDNFQILMVKSIRKFYHIIFSFERNIKPECIQDAGVVSQIIFDALASDKPCMIARLGSTELTCLVNYIGVIGDKNKYLSYFKGKTQPWWWEQKIIDQMQNWSGFFPATQERIEEFCQLMLNDLPFVDVLGSWLPSEKEFEKELSNCQKVNFELMNPYFSQKPWTKSLEGKKILVVHPFAHTIEAQYKKRNLLFKDNLLPEFQLFTIEAVQSIAGSLTRFNDWFEALEYMKSEIERVDFDICLIGCGAYGFPLAAHVKRLGKKAIHMGGSLQILFGIRGKRWENPDYNPMYNYAKLMNEHWVYPAEKEKPINASSIEGGCYW